MLVILMSIFSAIIIYITVFSIIKVLIIAYKREEITFRKFVGLVISSIVIGLFTASILPFGYQKIFDIIL